MQFSAFVVVAGLFGNRYMPTILFHSTSMSPMPIAPFGASCWRGVLSERRIISVVCKERKRVTTSQEECYSSRGSRDRFAGADLCSKYLQGEPRRAGSAPNGLDDSCDSSTSFLIFRRRHVSSREQSFQFSWKPRFPSPRTDRVFINIVQTII